MASPAARNRRSRRSPLAGALALAALLAPAGAGALDGSHSAGKFVGGWDLSLNDTNRRCHLLLRSDSAEQGLMIGMPAGCRRALPILTGVDAWRAEKDGVLGFTDREGSVVLEFAALAQDRLVATGPEGEIYELASAIDAAQPQKPQPIDENDMTAATRPRAAPGFLAQNAPTGGFRPIETAPLTQAQAQTPRIPAARQPAAAPAPAAAGGAVRTNELAGRYAILRENNKDTGCMLTLDDKSRGPGGFRAILAPACRDQGIVIFDPLGWSVDRNRLALTARKGHKAHFERQPDGTWQKDPKEGGKALGFRKL